MLATMHIETHGEVTVARIVGEIDASNANDFANQLKETLPNSAIALVVDLCETEYIDSSGVHLIFDLADALRRRQQILHLVVAPDSFVGDVLGVVNVTGAAHTSPTLVEALEALKNPDF
jgi:anti-anti-sigma factor